MDITRVVYGYTSMPMRMILPDGDETKVPIDLAFFLIRLPDATVLVDAGCDSMKGFVLHDFIGPVEALRQLGVRTEDITHIIVTHAHADHMAGIMHFPNACIIGQRQALEKGQKYLLPTHTVIPFDEQYSALAPLKVVHIGGHAIGSCVVEAGDTVLCGDECYTRANLELDIPTATTCDPERSRAFLDRYKGWKIQLCHQP